MENFFDLYKLYYTSIISAMIKSITDCSAKPRLPSAFFCFVCFFWLMRLQWTDYAHLSRLLRRRLIWTRRMAVIYQNTQQEHLLLVTGLPARSSIAAVVCSIDHLLSNAGVINSDAVNTLQTEYTGQCLSWLANCTRPFNIQLIVRFLLARISI